MKKIRFNKFNVIITITILVLVVILNSFYNLFAHKSLTQLLPYILSILIMLSVVWFIPTDKDQDSNDD
ncbi:putative membrane protein YdjX (TVP38/TMEM64 family) [Paenibacillus sp. BK720]|nr:putative membrane protein YdjX (TVP38/TMEM64 family) [Paenibacillus sp. BK720]